MRVSNAWYDKNAEVNKLTERAWLLYLEMTKLQNIWYF